MTSVNDAASSTPLRLPRWRKSYLLLLPLLIMGVVEFAIDPFPNSLWLLRILNTKYLVHVRADLTVDGEPLVLERTIRCFNPVDFGLWASRAEKQPGLRSNGQAGDTLAATTSKGRLFAINVPDACGALGSRLRPDGQYYEWTDPATNDVTPLHLSKNELETPVVFEIHDGRKASQIDAYIARDLLRQGYHGVKLNELLLEKAAGSLIKDWNGYDWFGKPNWTRHFSENSGTYSAAYALAVPESRWDEVMDSSDLHNYPNGQLTKKAIANLAYLRTEMQNKTIYPNDIYPAPFYDMLARWRYENDLVVGAQQRFIDPQLPPTPKLPTWIPELMIPCVHIHDSNRFKCNSEKLGVWTYTPYAPFMGSDPHEYLINGDSVIAEPAWTEVHYLTVSPRILYTMDIAESNLVGR